MLVRDRAPVRTAAGGPGASLVPSPSASASATPTPSPTTPPSFDIAVSGDLLIHSPVAAQGRRDAGGSGYDFRAMLAPVAPEIRGADLALCHDETPISADNKRLSGYPMFWVPRELATAIEATGYDGCSTASNHTLDQGVPGIKATLDTLDKVGVGHTGSARMPEEARQVKIYDVGGVKVAHLSYAYGFNGFKPPAGKEWLVNKIAVPAILEQAHRARELGAQLVVVSLHWGVEYHAAPTPEQLEVADQLTASDDVDVIVGHHAHVLQPIRTVNGKLVVFGLGNLLSGQSGRAGLPAATQDGAVVLLRAEPVAGDGGQGPRYRVSQYRAVLTVVEPRTFRVRPVLAALADSSTPATLRRDAKAALARQTKVDPAYGSGRWLKVGS
ncbi:MAG: CapA family protein [Kineosporiaceae bacterium]